MTAPAAIAAALWIATAAALLRAIAAALVRPHKRPTAEERDLQERARAILDYIETHP